MAAKELPDRFYQDGPAGINVVGPNGELIPGEEYFKQRLTDDGRIAGAPFMVKLDSQQVELMGRAALECRLIQHGFEIARPNRDNGIDLIVFLNESDHFAAVPLQMKASTGTAFGIDRRYEKVPNLVFAFVWDAQSANPAIFLLTYQETFDIIPETAKQTRAWRRNGKYHWSRTPKKIARKLEKHENCWEWLRAGLHANGGASKED